MALKNDSVYALSVFLGLLDLRALGVLTVKCFYTILLSYIVYTTDRINLPCTSDIQSASDKHCLPMVLDFILAHALTTIE